MLHDIMGIDRALPWLSLAFACGYLAGSIPFGLIMARVFQLGDLRKIGSGNIGATNVLRTGNKRAALATLVLDALKGYLPVMLFLGWGDLAAQAAALGAFIGHCFPVWLRFRGGKGVATFLGIVLALNFPSGLAVCASWLAATYFSRVSSVGALAASALGPIWFWAFGRYEAVLAVALLAVIVWLRHRENIARLLAGTEPKVGKGGRRD